MDIEPPNWSLESISMPQDTASNLSEVYNEAFFADHGNKRKAAKDKLNEFGFEIIGEGTGRLAVKSGGIPDGVIAKVAIRQRGYQDNQEECYMREDIPSEVRQFTTPVLDYDTSQNWMAVEECQAGGGATSEIFDVLEAAGVQYNNQELGPANVGYYNGRPCIIDWASLF